MQVFPFPATAERRAIKITFVADQIAFHAPDTGGHNSIREIVDSFEVITVIEASSDRRITAAKDDQIAFDRTFVGLFLRVNGGDEMIVGR